MPCYVYKFIKMIGYAKIEIGKLFCYNWGVFGWENKENIKFRKMMVSKERV